ncbi:SpoIID/LytB domain-containing protein [bacterium]|nr:SpoIID/LytB domain-containing protein [bacterium]MBU4561011.1 SpoIID/LytB domain-containing protein [bacterium]
MRVLSLFLAILLFSSSAFSQPSIHDVVTIKKEIEELKEKYKRDLVTGEEYEEILTLLEKKLAVATEYQKKREEKSYAQKEFEKAQKLSDYEDYEGAGRIYDKLLEKTYPQKQFEYGKDLYEKGDYDQAPVVYRKLLANYPESEWADDAHFGLGMVYHDLGKFDKALEEFTKVSESKFKSELSFQTTDMIQKSLLASYEIPYGIRVLVLQGVRKVKIRTLKGFKIVDLTNGETITFVSLDKLLSFKRTQEGIKIRGKQVNRFVTVPLKIIALKEDDLLRINGEKYRGQVVIRRDKKGRLNIINEVNIDDYLYGVLPHEISPAWPLEAMKAQAVASRTLALYRKRRSRAKDYDLDATIFAQIYRGMEGEDRRTNQAVEETRGKVLTYQGKIVNSIFHATCGGHTEEAKNVWAGSEEPYLKSISCTFCKDSPYYQWEKRIKKGDLRNVLEEKGLDLSRIREIEITEKSPTGRAVRIAIRHRKATQPLMANNFRLFIGPDLMRSVLFTVSKEKNEFIFRGHGWGHGVGMCQWGAKGMAEKGKDYKEILKHYYTGVEIEKVY